MKIKSAEFVKSALRPDDYPRNGRPEVAFVGRSNVGKSSLLNALLQRRGLAKTSSTPGKTQTVNFFDVNGAVYFVDLPGYGYAKVPKTMKDAWVRVMTEYLMKREPLRLAVALVDIRHEPSEKDMHMLELLEDAEVPTVVVATKADKIKRGQWQKQTAVIREGLRLEAESLILPFSSETGEGVPILWRVIDETLGQAG